MFHKKCLHQHPSFKYWGFLVYLSFFLNKQTPDLGEFLGETFNLCILRVEWAYMINKQDWDMVDPLCYICLCLPVYLSTAFSLKFQLFFVFSNSKNMHLKSACNSDILLKSDLRGFKWKIKKNTANIPLYKGDTVLLSTLPSWCSILRWKIRIQKEQGTGSSVCIDVCLCVSLVRQMGGYLAPVT